MTTTLIHTSVLSLTLSTAFANDATIVGVIKKHVDNKIIPLLHIQLSDEKKASLTALSHDALIHTNQFSIANKMLSEKKQLGMNDVPVLDQGAHGTCVTFATTAALDASIGKGDYISQLCNLQLGNYLEQHGYSESGWDGAWASTVINQMSQYGIVNMTYQRSKGCGGLKEYPANNRHIPTSFIDPEQFQAASELIFGKVVNWTDIYQQDKPEITLARVKSALKAGNRLVFAVVLPRTDLGMTGAVGKHKTWFAKDTWVLTSDIIKAAPTAEAAHEMVITGFDDSAEAVDPSRNKHKGLLTLRNSWGTGVGYYGEFYMSYDYFKLLVLEAGRFSPQAQ